MKAKQRFLSVLLSLVMALGLLPGMSSTAYADGDLPYDFNDSGDYKGQWQYPFNLDSTQLSKIINIEVLMDIESFPEGSWGDKFDTITKIAKNSIMRFLTKRPASENILPVKGS